MLRSRYQVVGGQKGMDSRHPWTCCRSSESLGGESVRLLRPSNLLSRAFGFLGRVVLKIGVTRRLVLAVAGIAAIVILVFAILTLVLLGR